MTSKQLYEYAQELERRIASRDWPMTPRVIEVRDKGPVFAETGYDETGYWLRTNAKIKRVKCYAGCTICSFYISMCDWEIWLEWDK